MPGLAQQGTSSPLLPGRVRALLFRGRLRQQRGGPCVLGWSKIEARIRSFIVPIRHTSRDFLMAGLAHLWHLRSVDVIVCPTSSLLPRLVPGTYTGGWTRWYINRTRTEHQIYVLQCQARQGNVRPARIYLWDVGCILLKLFTCDIWAMAVRNGMSFLVL